MQINAIHAHNNDWTHYKTQANPKPHLGVARIYGPSISSPALVTKHSSEGMLMITRARCDERPYILNNERLDALSSIQSCGTTMAAQQTQSTL